MQAEVSPWVRRAWGKPYLLGLSGLGDEFAEDLRFAGDGGRLLPTCVSTHCLPRDTSIWFSDVLPETSWDVEPASPPRPAAVASGYLRGAEAGV